MAEPPHKRARRPDSSQMWEESERRASAAPRGPREERGGERRDDRRDDRNRDRRYRSRSPRDSRGDRDRERDRERGGRRDKLEREGGGGSRRDYGERDRAGGRDYRGGDRERDGGRDRDARERERPRERSRDRTKRDTRSRSPRRDRERDRDGRRDDEVEKEYPHRPVDNGYQKTRSETPPVSFKVSSSVSGQDHERMELDGDAEDAKGTKGKKGKKAAKKMVEEDDDDDDDLVVEDDGMAAMKAMMGFGGFGTTHEQKVAGNDVYAVRKEKKLPPGKLEEGCRCTSTRLSLLRYSIARGWLGQAHIWGVGTQTGTRPDFIEREDVRMVMLGSSSAEQINIRNHHPPLQPRAQAKFEAAPNCPFARCSDPAFSQIQPSRLKLDICAPRLAEAPFISRELWSVTSIRIDTMHLLSLGVAALLARCTVAAAGDASIRYHEVARKSNESLLWGPYRPNLYFGVRPRIPKSLMGGLMWSRVDNYQDVQTNFRYTCEQGDNMKGYGWDEYDARTGGQQTMYDQENGIDIKTTYVRIPGGSHGGGWAVRVRGTVREDAPPDLTTTVVWSNALEGLGSLELENEPEELGYEGDVTLKGDSGGLGQYKVTVTAGKGKHPKSSHPSYAEKPLDRTFVHSLTTPEPIMWQAKVILFKSLKEQIDKYLATFGEEDLPPPYQLYTLENTPDPGNMYLIQKVFEGDFEFDVIFNSASAGKDYTSRDVSEILAINSKGFWDRFVKTFDPQPPFAVENLQRFAGSMFSNLLGGLGYFYGDSVVDRSYAPEYEEENEGFWEETAAARARKQEALEGPSELFSTVPSRPFFPRGFLWDEGFHLLPIADWDLDLSLEVVNSWFSLMDDDGWIGREQILGAEARSKVPAEFQVQYPHYANPPTLFFIIDKFISKIQAMEGSDSTVGARSNSVYLKDRDLSLHFLRELYPKLRTHYFWYKKTQSGDVKTYDREAFSTKEAYRWRGRTPQHILTSGLDDYPRPQPPHPGELHVDLISWMGMMTKSLKNIATLLDIADDVKELATIETAILRNIDDLHWSEKEKCYCDATIDDYEEHALVCHKGYISLFPFLTGLLDPESEKLGHILKLIGDKEQLWSEHGLRSLSLSDEFYGTAENYWRGPIWMNINYLAVVQLLRYAQSPGPHKALATDLYNRLRLNLVATVYESWVETGFAWEQYNPETGKGQRTAHFTGWTTLVVKIMGMPDLSGGKVTLDTREKGTHDEL